MEIQERIEGIHESARGLGTFLSLQYNPTPVTYNLRGNTRSHGVLEEATYGYEGHGFEKKHC